MGGLKMGPNEHHSNSGQGVNGPSSSPTYATERHTPSEMRYIMTKKKHKTSTENI